MSFYLHCHCTAGEFTIMRSETTAMDQDGIPPGSEDRTDTVEVAGSVTHEPFDWIVDAPETAEEEAAVEDDKILELLPEGVPGSEVIEEVTPEGEEPPSEVVAEEVFTEATAVVIAKPAMSATEVLTPEQEVTLEAAVEASSEAVTDTFLDVTPDVLTVELPEEHTEVTEAVPDRPESAEVEVLGESEGAIPPEEHLSGAHVKVRQDKVKVSTDATPIVFLMTDQDFEETTISTMTGVKEQTPTVGSATGEEEGEKVRQPKEIEEATFTAEDAEEEPVEASIEERPVKTVDETTKQGEETFEAPAEPTEGEETPMAPIKPVEKEGGGVTENEAQATVKTMQEPESAEETVETVGHTDDAKEAETKVTEHTTEPTQEPKLGEESVRPSGAQVELVEQTAKETEPKEEPVQLGLPSKETEPEEEIAQKAELTVEPAKEAELIENTAEESTEPATEPPQEVEIPKKTEPIGEAAQEAELIENTAEESTEPTTEPAQEVEISKKTEPVRETAQEAEVTLQEEPTPGSPPQPEAVAKEDKSVIAILSADKSQEVAQEEPLKDPEQATFEGTMEENSGVAELAEEGSQPQVPEDEVPETFEDPISESDEVITPPIVVVPEDTEGLLPGPAVEETLEPKVKVELPGDSEVELHPETTKSIVQVFEPASEVPDFESFHKLEKEVVPEAPRVVHPDVVTTTGGETIAPEEVPQEFPDEPVLKGSPGEDVIQGAPKEAEVISTDVTAEDAVETMTEAPAEVTSEFLDTVIPETSVEVTESVQGSAVDFTEEPTSVTSSDITPKYVIEYNNGNFLDITHIPRHVDDNVLGNNGFGMKNEEENSVSTQGSVVEPTVFSPGANKMN